MLDLVGLDGHANSYPDQLSGGMQQRVGLARALAVDPEVMFFDEPFSALDPLIRRDMQNEVIRLHHEVGKTMIFITHDLAEALKLGDHIVIMRDGRIVQAGRPGGARRRAGRRLRPRLRPATSRRRQVLSLRWVMRDPRPDDELDGPEFPPTRSSATPSTPRPSTEKPIRVVDDGQLLGVVDRADILASIAGERAMPRRPARWRPRRWRPRRWRPGARRQEV